jgi:gag-polypeptide of LTR copia-type
MTPTPITSHHHVLSFPSHLSSVLAQIPNLSSSNWTQFKQDMEMFFIASGAGYLIGASSSTTIPPQCAKLDLEFLPHIWSKVDYELRYLIHDANFSTLKAWISLLSHFQKSTMPQRIAARQQLYSVVHDPSKPIDVFIFGVTSAAKVLADLGHKVEDTEIKDILLMKLDDSYASVRTSIMTCQEEPDLSTIKSLLLSASSSFLTPSHPTFVAASMAQTSRSRRPKASHHSSPSLAVHSSVYDSVSLPPSSVSPCQSSRA